MQNVLFRIFAGLLAHLPQPIRWQWATCAAAIATWVRVRRVVLAEENIHASFPEYTSQAVRRIAFNSVQNLFQVFFEIPFLASASMNRIVNMVHTENAEQIRQLLATRKKAIFISAHFGNWECIAQTGPLVLGCPVTIVGKPQRNAFVNTYLDRMRCRFGNDIIPMEGSIRKMMRLLEENKSIALLADQCATRQDLFVNFFGRPAPTYKTAASLSLRFHAPLIFSLAERINDWKYRIVYQEIPSDDLDGATEENVRILTERHVNALEDAIRKQPGQWLWLHRRWKFTEYAAT